MQKDATTNINHTTIYVGMDVHKDSYTLCAFDVTMPEPSHIVKVPASYQQILKYLERMRDFFGANAHFICGYEAGCLGYSLYHQLIACNVDCIILAPNTMLKSSGKRIKTDSRDAKLIAQCLAYHTYSEVSVPSKSDEEIKEYIRMRNDHKIQLKSTKQQILAFCLRHNIKYKDGSKYWTTRHLLWIRSLKLEPMLQEILDEYMITFEGLVAKIERLDHRIEEFAKREEYCESVRKLTCFLGIKTYTALAIIAEISDFNRFPSADKFAAFLGLVPGEHSSGDKELRLGITKAGNKFVRTILTESAHSYSRGQIGRKSKALRVRQAGNPPAFIAYADRANERLRRRHHYMAAKGKHANVIKTSIARELACFIWGAMTNHTQ